MDRIIKNHCIVDALAVALDIDKKKVLIAVETAIGNDETKFSLKDLSKKKITNLGKLDRQYHKVGKGKIFRKMSVMSFLKLYPTGTFYIRTVKTAACVKNGMCVVGEPGSKDGIVEAFKIG